jgi:hypothetical protein
MRLHYNAVIADEGWRHGRNNLHYRAFPAMRAVSYPVTARVRSRLTTLESGRRWYASASWQKDNAEYSDLLKEDAPSRRRPHSGAGERP